MIFPLMWFAFGMFGMWMSHIRHRDMMRMIETYAAQGKEPPKELIDALSRPRGRRDWQYAQPDDYWMRRYDRYGPYRTTWRAIVFLSLAMGFGFLSFTGYAGFWSYNHGRGDGAFPVFMILAIVFGALGAGALAMMMFHPERRDRLDDPKNRP